MIRRGQEPAQPKVPNTVAPQKRRRKRRAGRGVLWTIALTLAVSGLLRLGGESGRAIASELTSVAALGARDASPVGCAPAEDIAQVLALLRDREEKVTTREAALADRMQALSIAESQVKRHMAELAAAETALEATISRSSSAAEDDLARLTSVYESMKPKDAAGLFAAMDPTFAAGFLGRMRPDAAASILSGLDPEQAYAISVLLAGRNAAAPTQ